MAEEKYVLISLDDEKSKDIAEVLGNKTCKDILDLLSEKELSETEIAGELKIPMNTADYNIKKLVRSGLIEEKRHLFSVKGKRIPYYRVSNKHIVISPRKTSMSRIRSIFPVVILSSIFTIFLLLYEKSKSFVVERAVDLQTSIQATGTIESAVENVDKVANVGGGGVLGFFSNLSVVNWFLIALWLGIVIFVIFSLTSERRSKIFKNH